MNFQNSEYEGLELSTKILIEESLNRGLEVEILDKKDNFIALKKGSKVEYVKQATKTSVDSYISVLIMENKSVTKNLLDREKIRTPRGKTYNDIESALREFSLFQNSGAVVKPNSTNFGKGVGIVSRECFNEDYTKAVKAAFQYDDAIIAEEFIPGREYRFLVVGGEVAGVLHRMPANVEGDGKRNVEELAREKNKSPLRGVGYKKPLEKINLGKEEKAFLALLGKNCKTVPAKGEIVFLRGNSNISSGGDSLDYTDEVSELYKKIAVNSAEAAGAKICGADIIIKDINAPPQKDNYAVIELNFNPALHIHNYPYKGKNRRVERKILDLLGF